MAQTIEGLDLKVENGIARLTVARPEKKNAINHAMWAAIADNVTDLSRESDIRALVLSGQGTDFSAGADISEFDAVRRDAGTARAYEKANSDAFAALRDAPFPTIAAISGICYGGGFGLAAACDLRIATPDATFCVPAARLGLAYPQEAMVDIVTAAGPQMARYLTFTAARIDAPRALAAGFLLEIIDPAHLSERATALAEQIAVNAPLSVRASKASIRAVITGRAEDAQAARALGDVTFNSLDYAEGRAAFRERRKPHFEGR